MNGDSCPHCGKIIKATTIVEGLDILSRWLRDHPRVNPERLFVVRSKHNESILHGKVRRKRIVTGLAWGDSNTILAALRANRRLDDGKSV